MATTNITIEIDEELKREADELFEKLGMTMTTAFIMFVKRAVQEQKIPFTIGIPNKETLEAFEEGDRLANDPNAKRFTSIEALFEDLNE